MAVNLSPSLLDTPPLPGSVASIWEALAKVGVQVLTHAIFGSLRVPASLSSTGLLRHVRRGERGLKNDGYSHGAGFLVAFCQQSSAVRPRP